MNSTETKTSDLCFDSVPVLVTGIEVALIAQVAPGAFNGKIGSVYDPNAAWEGREGKGIPLNHVLSLREARPGRDRKFLRHPRQDLCVSEQIGEETGQQGEETRGDDTGGEEQRRGEERTRVEEMTQKERR